MKRPCVLWIGTMPWCAARRIPSSVILRRLVMIAAVSMLVLGRIGVAMPLQDAKADPPREGWTALHEAVSRLAATWPPPRR